MRTRFVIGCLLIVAAVCPSQAQTPMGTVFTYQGLLKNAGGRVNGVHDLRFRLYDAAASGAQAGATICFNNVTIADGIFTLPLDFGAQFNGNQRFLEIDVRADSGLGCGNGTGFVTLSPRQALSATPYALFAQTVPVPLMLAGTSDTHIIRGENASTTFGSSGVYGLATGAGGGTSGVFGQSASTSGFGVFGKATTASGLTFGGRFESVSQSGTGVYGSGGGTGVRGLGYDGVRGEAIGSSGYGVWGEASGTDGRGVSGHASAATGTTIGMEGVSASTDGRGVLGWATAVSGATFGVSARSDSTSGRGVYGLATASSGSTYGVYGESNSSSDTAVGVFGLATGADGVNYGGRFETSSRSGRGVYGIAQASTGVTYGVHGASHSTSGRGVYGEATNLSGNTYGVHGRTSGNNGIGVVGQAISASGTTYGVYGVSDSFSGFDFYAAGNGLNYGASSSRRWKSSIEPIGQPLDKLRRLRGVYFNWDAEHGGHHDVGMIAEEVGAVRPEIVNYEENGVDAIGMDYSKMTPLLVEAVNALRAELDRQINALAAENADLRARLDRIERALAVQNSSPSTRNSR